MTPLCAAYHAPAAVDPDKLNHSGFLLHVRRPADRPKLGTSDWTPLHWASANGHPKIVNLLIDHATPLRLASGNGHSMSWSYCLTRSESRHGGKDGRRPYEVAESSGHRELRGCWATYTKIAWEASDMGLVL
ncbi:hypothetical protein BC826DRAFT_1024045 [Russula brevipes]|nr:hypothetical protein BC826DRAFT_1024045 [Russula brevipes]